MNVDATVDSLRLAGLPSDVRARPFSYRKPMTDIERRGQDG